MSERVVNEARRFRAGIRRALIGRGAALGALGGSAIAGVCTLAGRFVGLPPLAADRLVFVLAVTVGAAVAAGAAAARRAPPLADCLAALDAAAAAGGLIMSAGSPGAEAWQPAVPQRPRIVWRSPRTAGGLALSCAFSLLAAFLPQRLFVGSAAGGPPTVAALVDRTAAQIALLEEERLLPAQEAAALSNQLAEIGRTGDAADPARTLEALDHVADELARAAGAQAEALNREQAALQAAMALAEQLAARLDSAPAAEGLAAAAAEALNQFLNQATLPSGLASNLLAAALVPPGLSPASLRELYALARAAGALNEARLMRLGELKLVEASACRGGGSCTNAAACAGALARFLDEEGPAAEAAASLAALCAAPGSGAVSRGRGDAPLTWTDPSTTERTAFKEDALRPGRPPAADQARLEGLSAAAPEVPETPAVPAAGALTAAAAAQGTAPHAPVLPRHREAVERFFDSYTEEP